MGGFVVIAILIIVIILHQVIQDAVNRGKIRNMYGKDIEE